MKDSYQVEMHRNSDGMPFAITMRADYTAEHQWGIGPLLDVVVTDKSLPGLHGLRIASDRVGPDGCALQVKESYVYGWRNGRKSKLRATLLIGDASELHPDYIVEVADRDKALNGTWDAKNFLLSSRDSEGKAMLHEISQEAKTGNVLIYQGFNPVKPESGGCLMLLIESRTPPDCLNLIEELLKRQAV